MTKKSIPVIIPIDSPKELPLDKVRQLVGKEEDVINEYIIKHGAPSVIYWIKNTKIYFFEEKGL